MLFVMPIKCCAIAAVYDALRVSLVEIVCKDQKLCAAVGEEPMGKLTLASSVAAVARAKTETYLENEAGWMAQPTRDPLPRNVRLDLSHSTIARIGPLAIEQRNLKDQVMETKNIEIQLQMAQRQLETTNAQVKKFQT